MGKVVDLNSKLPVPSTENQVKEGIGRMICNCGEDRFEVYTDGVMCPHCKYLVSYAELADIPSSEWED